MSGPVLEILVDPDLMEFRVWQETGTVTIYYSVYCTAEEGPWSQICHLLKGDAGKEFNFSELQFPLLENGTSNNSFTGSYEP